MGDTYYVLTQEGNKYGPADLPTLNAWAMEGRLLPGFQLEEVSTGRRFPAYELAGLHFPAVNQPQPQIPQNPPAYGGPQNPQQPPSFSNAPTHPSYYQRPGSPGPQAQYGQYYPPQSNSGITSSWVWGSIGAVMMIIGCCCPFTYLIGIGLSIGGIYTANQARNQGDPRAQAPYIFNIVILTLSILFGIGSIIMLIAMDSIQRPQSPFKF